MKNPLRESIVISPLNYAGNKSKVVKEILEIANISENVFVDVFCGSCTVSVNSSCNTIVCNDNDKNTCNLLNYFSSTKPSKVVKDVYFCIQKYGLTDSANMPKGTYIIKNHEGLSNYNRSGFLKMKDDFNQKKETKLLFPLSIFGFNHYMRFNKQGFFNVPVGKNDFYKIMQERTVSFLNRMQMKNIIISNKDFRDPSLYKFEDCIYYFDPPYLITNAPYNQNWGAKDEIDLLKILDELNSRNQRFMLSNVLVSNGKKNTYLDKWIKERGFQVHQLHRQYRNANYRRKNDSLAIEVLITNF